MRTAPATKIDVLDLVPATDSIPKESLLVNAKAAGIGRNKARGFITELVEGGELFLWKRKRPGTNPRLDLARREQPAEELALAQ